MYSLSVKPLCSVIGLILLCVGSLAQGNKPDQPNIILILADDMGYGDLGCYNPQSKIPTPNLDRMAREGIRFTDAHSGGPTCIPSRYALMTGRFASRKPMNFRNGPLIEPDRSTLASILRDSGYHTAMVGKWHLGFDPYLQDTHANIDFTKELFGGPLDCGFESFFGMHASLDIQPYFYIRDRHAIAPPSQPVNASTGKDEDQGWNDIQGSFWRKGWMSPNFDHHSVTPRFFEEASRVISAHQKKNSNQPLFLYLALPSPHTPWLPDEKYRGQSGAGSYGDFIVQIDELIGELVKQVDQSSLGRNCLFLFSSDNGPVWYDRNIEQYGHRASGPLNGMKFSEYEGGHRMPFLARWPSYIPVGKTSDHVVEFSDLLPTFAELAGFAKPGQKISEDGYSFLPILKGETSKSPRPAIVHTRNCIREGKWKLIRKPDKKSNKTSYELYDLQNDLGERANLSDQYPEMVSRLTKKLDTLLQ
jgi:arylsulfatase A